jgi:hypothetical protein
MFITSVNITREGYYGYGRHDPTKPLRAKVAVEGQQGKIEVTLTPEASDLMVALIADELVKATRATAELMTSSLMQAAASEQIAGPDVAVIDA